MLRQREMEQYDSFSESDTKLGFPKFHEVSEQLVPDISRYSSEKASIPIKSSKRILPLSLSNILMRQLDNSLFDYSPRKSSNFKKESEVDMSLPFPIKLHYILSNPEYQEFISWLPHGRAWKVTNSRLFEEKIIPNFFRSIKYASFMRQVNGWAFNRITDGPDANSYYHDMFLRGIPNLCFEMKRPPKVKYAAAAARIASGAGFGAPNFDRISKIAPLPPSLSFRPIIKEAKGPKGPKFGMEVFGVWDTESVSSLKTFSELPVDSTKENEDDTNIKEEEAPELSKADIKYLTHQNQILTSTHFVQIQAK